MKLATPCLDLDRIRQYLSAGSPIESDLEDHLTACSACAEQLRQCLAGDSLLRLMRQVSPPTDTPVGLGERAASLWSGVSPTTGAAQLAPDVGDTPPDVSSLLHPPQQPGEIGRLGGFRVLRVLGRGGMGVVCLAEDEQLGRPVALKLMRVELLGSAEARRQFLAEARAMAAVEHDHVVAVHHVGEDGVPFLVMPLLRGETLESRLQREGKLGTAEAVRVAREIALGLAAAHQKGLIHRDIKPGNVWLEEGTGRVKLLDFGLARVASPDGNSTASVIMGTPAYMSPEQAAGEKPDARSDLFALGCVLYRMLTGKGPFDRDTVVAVLAAVQTFDPEPPHALNPQVPTGLSELTMHLLRKKHEDRPASAAEVVAMLEKPEAIAPPVVKMAVRRRPAMRWAALVACVLLLGGALAAAVMSVMQPGWGEVKIEELDEDVQVVVSQAGKVIEILDKKGKQSATIRAGIYEVELKNDKGVFKLETPNFTLKRGGKEIVKVTRKPGIDKDPVVPKPAGRQDIVLPKGGDPFSQLSLVSRPEKIDGVLSWIVDTVAPRGRVMAASFHPKTGELVTLSEDGLLRFWDAKAGKFLRAIAISTKQQLLLWDWHRLGYRGSTPTRFAPIAWTPDGKAMAIGLFDGTLYRIDAETGNASRLLERYSYTRGDVGLIKDLAWSPTGDQLALTLCGGSGQVLVHDLAKDERYRCPDVDVGSVEVGILAWSPDGKRLAVGAAVWEVGDNPKAQTLGLEQTPDAVAWSPDGKLALAGKFGVAIWTNGKPHIVVNEPAQLVRWLDNKRLSAVVGATGCEIDVNSKKSTRSAQLANVNRVPEFRFKALSPDGKYIIGTHTEGSNLLIWDAEGNLRNSIGGYEWVASWSTSPDGKRIAITGDRHWRTMEVATGKLLAEIPNEGIYSLEPCLWSPGGKHIYQGCTVANADNLKAIWGTHVECFPCWGPSGDWLAHHQPHADEMHGVCILDVRTGKKRLVGPGGRAPIAVSRDGKKIAYSGAAQICDVEGKEKPVALEFGDAHGDVLGFFPDGRAVIVQSRFRTPVNWVMDSRTGKKLRELSEDSLGCVRAFSPNGKQVAVVALNGTVTIRETATWKEVRTFAVPPIAYRFSGQQEFLHYHPPHWASDDLLFVGGGGPNVFVLDVKTGERRGVFVPMPNGKALVVGATGHHTARAPDKELIYIVATKERQKTLTPAEFAAQYKWKNDPDKVRLLPD